MKTILSHLWCSILVEKHLVGVGQINQKFDKHGLHSQHFQDSDEMSNKLNQTKS